MHGWRYVAAVELAEAGCSDAEIQSVTGHKALEMVQKYRQAAAQKALSKQAQQRRESAEQNRTRT
jgi:integrase